MRLKLHFHVGWLDGVYSHRLGGDVTWHEDEGVADADVAALVRRIAVRVKQALTKAGKWWGEGDAADAGDDLDGERQLLLELASGAVTGRAALGECFGQGDVRLGRGTRAEPFVKGPLCADHDGFSLHAAVRVAAGDRKCLERLLRYAGPGERQPRPGQDQQRRAVRTAMSCSFRLGLPGEARAGRDAPAGGRGQRTQGQPD